MLTQNKISIQKYIFFIGILLFVLKLIAFIMTNSVAILSDALESTVNIITGFMTLKSLQFAVKPRDEDHPYGHGKVELITASVEGILIGVAGIMIITEAFSRFGNPVEVVKLDSGIILLIFAALINYLMGRYSINQGIQQNSIALVSGGKHLISDTYSSIALIGGLVIYAVTGLEWIDSLLAIIFGIFILFTGYNVLKSTLNGLMDEADMGALKNLIIHIEEHKTNAWIYIHKLTYLKFGHVSHVDLHLTLPWYYDMKEAKKEIQMLKKIITEHLPEEDVDISIQSEPCEYVMCTHCNMICEYRKTPFTVNQKWTNELITGTNMYTKSI
ncbi:MAG: cation transporter [Saprospiraceae bacterium]|nr:cation transporter [Saprospiraceae bacterium]